MQGNELAMSVSTGNSLGSRSGSPSYSTANAAPPTAVAPAGNAAIGDAVLAVTPGTGGGGGQGIGGGTNGADMFGKKKRGRPRKYDAEGNLVAPSTAPWPSGSGNSRKKGRGKPLGSGNFQFLLSSGDDLFTSTAGWDFRPHMVMVNTGEDVAGKITSFVHESPRGICVLSANGAVSNVTIHQPGFSGGILRYEGRFEIVSLSGSLSGTDSGSGRSRAGRLSVSLAGPDGRVIGGGLAGSLIAASPIQVVVGSFMPNGFKIHKRKNHRGYAPASASAGAPSSTTRAAPVSHVNPEDYSLSTTPMQAGNQFNDIPIDNGTTRNVSVESAGWNNQRTAPADVNVSVLGNPFVG